MAPNLAGDPIRDIGVLIVVALVSDTLVDMVGDESHDDHNADIADRITGEIRRHDTPEVDEKK